MVVWGINHYMGMGIHQHNTLIYMELCTLFYEYHTFAHYVGMVYRNQHNIDMYLHTPYLLYR